jgi:hypothetical protein
MSQPDKSYQLLPAVVRLRDAAKGEPLRALLAVIDQQTAVLEEDLAQLYDNQFIETCDDWAVPYIGDLIGWRQLHGVAPKIASPRAEVANTIGYRRRKGTAVMLEQLARDVTGWPARVVEYFQLLATTQYLNHLRPANVVTPDLRQWEPLERINTPFETIPHSLDVRRIASGRGKYNIPNVGIFLWRLNSYPLTDATPRALDARRFFFSPLGNNTQLFTRPVAQPEFTHLATRMNVPDPISRRTLDAYLNDYYGDGKSLLLKINGQEVTSDQVISANLADAGGGTWAHQPPEKIAIDPVLGRIAFPTNQPPPENVTATFHYGFSSNMGGGEYDRSAAVPADLLQTVTWQIGVSAQATPVPGQIVATLTEAVEAWNKMPAGTVGVISVMDSASYDASLSGADAIVVPANSRLLIVGADWPQTPDATGQKRRIVGKFDATVCRPHLRGNISVAGTVAGSQANMGQLLCNGLLIEGSLEIPAGPPVQISIAHCTLVPGQALTSASQPQFPDKPSLIVGATGSQLQMDHSISGGWRVDNSTAADISESILDATAPDSVAFSAPDGFAPGGAIRIQNCTVIGKMHATLLELASNVVFWSRLAVSDTWPAPVWCLRRQSGCVRFTYLPLGSLTPRRYHCLPVDEADASAVTPGFNSLLFGDPRYAQLDFAGPEEIFTGADDGSEMGAFHELFEPQRIANLKIRLDEYLRFSLEAGIFFEPQLPRNPAGQI